MANRSNSLDRAPVIGITTYGRNERGEFHLYGNYIDVVRRAGGVPILLPPGETNLDEVLQLVDGLVFTGGGDIDPTLYNGEGHPAIYRVDPERDAFELALAKHAVQAELALLGICRGLQILSIASGGRLLPHVPDTFGLDTLHRQEEPLNPTRHVVDVVSGSLLADIVGTSAMEIVSWHHQAVPTVPPGWRATAYAPDGLIEALEHEAHPWAIALQWHPELSASEDPLQQKIFDAFVQAARVE